MSIESEIALISDRQSRIEAYLNSGNVKDRFFSIT